MQKKPTNKVWRFIQRVLGQFFFSSFSGDKSWEIRCVKWLQDFSRPTRRTSVSKSLERTRKLKGFSLLPHDRHHMLFYRTGVVSERTARDSEDHRTSFALMVKLAQRNKDTRVLILPNFHSISSVYEQAQMFKTWLTSMVLEHRPPPSSHPSICLKNGSLEDSRTDADRALS